MDAQDICAAVLQWHCSNSARGGAGPIKTFFHSCRIPPISIVDYVARIYRYAKCSPECMVIALMYIDRFLTETKISLTLYNVHRMILISVMSAAKIRDDIYFSNGYYGNIGGIPQEEVNRLEISFLTTIRWCLWVEPEEYYRYMELSIKKIAATKGTAQVRVNIASVSASQQSEQTKSHGASGVVVPTEKSEVVHAPHMVTPTTSESWSMKHKRDRDSSCNMSVSKSKSRSPEAPPVSAPAHSNVAQKSNPTQCSRPESPILGDEPPPSEKGTAKENGTDHTKRTQISHVSSSQSFFDCSGNNSAVCRVESGSSTCGSIGSAPSMSQPPSSSSSQVGVQLDWSQNSAKTF